MKGLIPAAGLGTRLRPLTYARSKPSLKVANKPIIRYAIDNLNEAGITDIGLIVSDETRLDIEEAVGELPGITLHYIRQDEQLGIAHAVRMARSWLAGDDFCLYLGDNLFGNGVQRYVNSFRENECDGLIALVRVPNPREFGVAVIDKTGKIERLVEKPDVPPSDLAVAGVYCFKNKVLDVIDGLQPSRRGEYEITDAIVGLMNTGTVRGLEVEGWWKDTGRPADLLDANRLILEKIEPISRGTIENSRLVGRVHIEEGAVVKNSTIIGPALIGAGAQLDNVFVGAFTSIGNETKLYKVEIEFSAIGDRAILEEVDVRFQECLIGRGTVVRGLAKVPRVHRLILGDQSQLELG